MRGRGRLLGLGCAGVFLLCLVVGALATLAGGGPNTAQNGNTNTAVNNSAGQQPAQAPAPVAAEPTQPPRVQKQAATKPTAAPKNEGKEEAAKVFKVGQPAKSGDVVWTVTKATKKNKLTAENMDPLTPGGVFVIVDLQVKNNGKEAKTVDTSVIHLVDNQGREFQASSDAIMYIPQRQNLFLRQINPGLQAKGQAVFDVPTDAKSLRFKAGDLTLNFFGGAEDVLIDLGL